MDLSFLSPVLLVAMILFIVIGAGIGALRGLIKTSVSLGGNIIAAVLAAVLTPVIINSTSLTFVDDAARSMMESLPKNFQNNADIEKLITAVFSMAGAVVLFVAIFVVLALLIMIPEIFINKAIVKATSKSEDGEKTGLSPVMRITGTLVGALCGFVVFVVFFSTTAGLVTTAGNITGEFVEDTTKKPVKNKDFAEIVTQIKDVDNMIEPVTKSPVISLVNTLGGKAIYDHVTTVKSGDKKVNLDTQAGQLYYTAMAALRAGDLMSVDLSDKLADLFNKPPKTDNGTTGGNTSGGNTEGNNNGGTAGGNTTGGTAGGETGPSIPPVSSEATFEEVMNDPEIKETVDTLAEALTKVDDFTAVISKDTVEQIMEESGADVSEISEEDKEMVKDYVSDYIDNFQCTPEEKEKLEGNIQDLLDMIGIDINLK